MAEEKLVPNYFTELNDVDVSKYIDKKNDLSYIPWTDAWAELKKRYPDSNRVIYENKDGWNYFTDGRTCWVKVGVTVNGLEHIEDLAVMDYRNKSIPFESVTSYDINKSIQRCTVKAIARHGLGLFVYRGEDLPEVVQDDLKEQKEKLDAAIKEVVALGKKLMKSGMTKEKLQAIVAAKNNGNGNPNSIPSVEVAEEIKQCLTDAKNASKKAPTEKKTEEQQ